MNKSKENMIYLKFRPEVKKWLKNKAREEEIDIENFIKQLIFKEMENDGFLLEGEDNVYRTFIREYLKIIRKF